MILFMCIYIYIYIYVYVCEGELKRSNDDIISTVYVFLDQWDPSRAIQMEEMCWLEGSLCSKINLIGLHFMWVS